MATNRRSYDDSMSCVGSSNPVIDLSNMERVSKSTHCDVRSGDKVFENRDYWHVERVLKRRYGELRSTDKGIPIACDCSAPVRGATCNSPIQRGERYLSCPYEISDGPGQGCGFKRWLEPALLEEINYIREERISMKKSVEGVTGKLEELEIKYDAVLEDNAAMEQYLENANGKLDFMKKQYDFLEAKYEALEEKYQKLNRYL